RSKQNALERRVAPNLARGFVAHSVEYRCGYTPSLAPRHRRNWAQQNTTDSMHTVPTPFESAARAPAPWTAVTKPCAVTALARTFDGCDPQCCADEQKATATATADGLAAAGPCESRQVPWSR